jgi:ATP-binding cassette, subfamily B, bacterial PglK
MTLLERENRAHWVLLILVALISSGLEVLGAALVYVLLAVVSDPSAAIELPLLGDIRELVDVEQEALFLGLAGLMAVFFVLRATVHIGEHYAQNRVANLAGARLATRMVEGYLSMPYAFHLGRNSSDLIRNCNQAVADLVRQVFQPVIRITAEVILVIAMLILLVTLAPGATGLAVLTLGGAAVLLLLFVQPRLKRIGRTAHRMNRVTLGILQQAFHGVRDINVLGLEVAFTKRYSRARKRAARVSYLHATAADLPKTIFELALLGFILALFAASVAFGDASQETLSVLGLFAYAGIRLQPSLQRIINGLNNLKFASAPIEDLHADLLLIQTHGRVLTHVEPLPFREELRFDGVHFRYAGSQRDALSGVNLTLRPGEVLGICGPTGGGKTTLVDVMTGLLEPTAGSVLVDGFDLKQHARAWQRNLGVVPQMVFLTDESLRENIALGVPADMIDDAAVKEAAHLAQLHPFVLSLPDGLDTVVGERGVKVSGGQRQRVAIARALYRRPKVLVFDEGTSALDNATEQELIQALARLRGDHTIVMIAHRLSTVRDADRIVVIEDGTIAGEGRYGELLASNSAFQRLASS